MLKWSEFLWAAPLGLAVLDSSFHRALPECVALGSERSFCVEEMYE